MRWIGLIQTYFRNRKSKDIEPPQKINKKSQSSFSIVTITFRSAVVLKKPSPKCLYLNPLFTLCSRNLLLNKSYIATITVKMHISKQNSSMIFFQNITTQLQDILSAFCGLLLFYKTQSCLL